MDSLFVLREKIQEIYAEHSKIIDKAVQFIVALVTFYLINTNVGFMKVAATPVATAALSVICTFFPMVLTVIAASALILAHMYAVSLATFAVTALIFLIMYIFYFRLTPKMALAVLLMPVACTLKIPYVVPVAYALLAGPVSIVAISCGTIVYYMMEYVEKAAAGMKGTGTSGLMDQISTYVKQVFQNKEMWIMVVSCIISFLIVYTIRRQSVNHAWKIAAVSGAVANIVVVTAGDMALGIKVSYIPLVIGGIAAIAAGLVLELFFFAVDYSKSENLQYEDDEYYYYVKAVPKLSVSTPEKTVKRINERRETEIIDTAEVRKRNAKRQNAKTDSSVKKSSSGKKHSMEEVDKLLLTKSLKRDLNLK